MKILNVFNRYLERGGEEILVERIEDLLVNDYEIRSLEFHSGDWVDGDARGKAPGLFSQAWRMVYNPSSLRRLREAENEFKPDFWLLHNVFPVGSAGIFREAKKRGVPVVYYCHNFRPYSVSGYSWAGKKIAPEGLKQNYWPEILAGAWQNSIIKTAWFAAVLKLAHLCGWFDSVKAWIAISEFMRQKFIEAGVPAERIFTIRHWWKVTERTDGIEDGGYYLFLGRLTVEKGLDPLLKAWILFKEAHPESKARLVICGDGPLRETILRAAQKDSSLQFEGVVTGEAKNRLLQKCRAVVVPSVWWEGLGLVAYEAYDFCKPVLAARSGGLTETVTDQKTGLLHEPGNAEELAEQLAWMEANPSECGKMGRQGREWLGKNAGEEIWKEKFARVIAKTFERKKVITVLAFSLLCENPVKLTGLNSMVREFISRSLKQNEQLRWILFVGPEHSFGFTHERLTIIRDYPGNNRLKKRLWADHFLVSPHARRLGAKLLLTIGFVPLNQSIPTVMHLFTLHHLDRSNRTDFFRSLYRRWAVGNGLRRATMVITNSLFAVEQILRSVPSIKEKLIMSYEGLDHDAVKPLPEIPEKFPFARELGLPESYTLWLSNLYPYKQAGLLIRAFAKLPEDLRRKYPIVFIGGDWNGEKSRAIELATSLGVNHQVYFPGWVEDRFIVPLLQNARIFVLPSREETFGRSAAEAMACGIPCVLNDIPTMREVAGTAASIVDFSDTPTVTVALKDALTDRTRRTEMIGRGLVRAGKFDFDILTRERMDQIYKILHGPIK